MITTFFIYAAAGIGSLFALGFISLAYEYVSTAVKMKKLILERATKAPTQAEMLTKQAIMQAQVAQMMRSAPVGNKMPKEVDEEAWEMLQEMMGASPNHPEIEEIEKDDQIIGVMFSGNSYPPELQ